MTTNWVAVGPLAGALLLSIGSTYLIGKHLTREGPLHVHAREYLTTRREIEPGETLQASDLNRLSWPAEDTVEGALGVPERAVGRTTLYPLSPGQPILDNSLALPGSGPGLASKVPNGMRAIALRSDEVIGVGGFLQPGSHVDVLATYHATSSAEPATSTVLQNAEVIAAGQQVKPDPEGKAVTATVVTILLTPQQAERALLASNQGVLHFVLRNNTDKATPLTEAVTLSELLDNLRKTGGAVGGPAPGVRTKRIVPQFHQVPDTGSVEIVLGGEGSAKGRTLGVSHESTHDMLPKTVVGSESAMPTVGRDQGIGSHTVLNFVGVQP